MVAISLTGIIATKSEEETGELIWALLEKEIDSTENTDNLRSLWETSRIEMEEGHTKRSFTKMIIKVSSRIFADSP